MILGTLRTDESITPNIFIAITLLAMLPSIIVYLGLQKHFNRGIYVRRGQRIRSYRWDLLY
ncbi:Uncharacterised protein [Kluyvera cryocrescens]|uniref:Uncharacterized protein n=1 Tax=Kluyvera cryocrescens TaxID=580 RepID=A0A485BXQ8_KLUCR|nr:Uncharacterised protein [Kluyvera cryocrescens]